MLKQTSRSLVAHLLLLSSLASAIEAQTANFFPRRSVRASRSDTVETHGTSALDTATVAGTMLDLPAGANAGIGSSEEDGAASGVVGVQVGSGQSYFFSALFNYGGPTKVPVGQSNVGAFVLNPTTQGSSVVFAGFGRIKGHEESLIQLRVGGRLSVAQVSFQSDASGASVSRVGAVIAVSPFLQLATKAFETGVDNQYQFILEAGFDGRFIASDLGQHGAFLANPDVLGLDKKAFYGVQATIALRLNTLVPFVRITHFGAPSAVSGLTGTQIFIGTTVLASIFHDEL